MKNSIIGFECLKDEYSQCPDFGTICKESLDNPSLTQGDFLIRDGYLFKGVKLCIPRRDFLVLELHARDLLGDFGKDKTIALVEDRFYWLSLKKDVGCIVSQCRTCKLGKCKKQNNSLYAPFPVTHTLWRDL